MPRKKKSDQMAGQRMSAQPEPAGQAPPSTPDAGEARQQAGTSSGGDAARPDPQRIAARAYELYLARGGGEGRAMDDWLAAEGELSGGTRD